MLIDWFTVGAQLINFFILVWLLKRFLYKPVLAAMDAREKQIQRTLREAETKKIAAEQERADFLARREDLERRQAEMLQQAELEVEQTRKDLLGQTREEVATQRARWLESLRNEQEALQGALTRSAEGELFATLRRLLADIADVGLEAQITDTFLRRLRALKPEEKTRLAASLRDSRCPPVVRSAFDLPGPTRASLEQALHTELGIMGEILFQTAPDLICGIEFVFDGHKVSWTLADSLACLEKSLEAALEQETELAAHGQG